MFHLHLPKAMFQPQIPPFPPFSTILMWALRIKTCLKRWEPGFVSLASRLHLGFLGFFFSGIP